jgi:hypothetical protein
VRKLRKLDQKLYGTDIDPASAPGPLLRCFRALSEVHPIVFGAYGEVSAGMEVLIGRLADDGHHRSLSSISWTTCSPRRASQRASYARKLERPASTRTHTSSLGARSSASRATARRTGGAETKMRGSIELGRRNNRHGAPGGTGHFVAYPLAGGKLLVGLAR